VRPKLYAPRESAHQESIECVVARMRASLDAPLRLEEMARLAHLSPYHFDRVFRSLTGLSAAAFQSALRIDAAKRALLLDDRPITDICFGLGYESVGSFTTRFTRAVGLAPTNFRAQVESLRDVDMCDALRRAAAAAGLDTAEASAVQVTLEGASSEHAVAWIGAFPKGIPDRVPRAGTLALGNAHVGFAPLGHATYHLMAASYPPSPRIADYLVQHERMRVATSGPLKFDDATHRHVRLRLRDLIATDPPILLALPLHTVKQQVARSGEYAAAARVGSLLAPS
jgi:AraC family transcriptional regulator